MFAARIGRDDHQTIRCHSDHRPGSTRRPTTSLEDTAYKELRSRTLAHTDPELARVLLAEAQQVTTQDYDTR